MRTQASCRPSEIVALFFGIALEEDEARRLDLAVIRTHQRVAAGLTAGQLPPAGFHPLARETADDA